MGLIDDLPEPFGGKSWESLRLEGKTTSKGCGIYSAGDPEKCYVELFVTDSGRVVPLNGGRGIAISGELLMQVYQWGLEDGAANTPEASSNVENVKE